jgi:pimeloyl-ACP methyl ester carboxylesterase
MPLNHFNPADNRTIDVVFGVLPASTRSRRGMFVTATGGPGSSGLAAADSYTAAFDPRLPRRFDIVFFDQRGIASSGGLDCPGATSAYYLAEFLTGTPQQEAAARAVARAFAQDCVAEMGNPESLPYLGTAQAVEDLEQFRRVMKDDQFYLYGESYGTQFAQTYAAAHGDHLAGLFLDGTVDLTLDGFEFYQQQAKAFEDVLRMTLDACGDDPACAADMQGDPQAAYDQLAAELSRRPQRYAFPLPAGGTTRREMSLTDLTTIVGGQVYGESDRLLFIRSLAAYASRGDLVPLARLLYLDLGVDPQDLAPLSDSTYSEAMYFGVECQDYFYPGATPEAKASNYLAAGDSVEAALPRLSAFFYGDLVCAYWPHPADDPARPAPLAAQGITTFVLGATADPATPVGNGLAVYRRLSDGYLFTQQGGPHVNQLPAERPPAAPARERM